MTAPTCSNCKNFITWKIEDMDGFYRTYTFCDLLGSKFERLPEDTCKQHETL